MWQKTLYCELYCIQNDLKCDCKFHDVDICADSWRGRLTGSTQKNIIWLLHVKKNIK